MGNMMSEKVQVFRTEAQLKEAVTDIQALKQRYEKVAVENKGKVFNTDLLFAIELGFLNGRRQLPGRDILSLLHYE